MWVADLDEINQKSSILVAEDESISRETMGEIFGETFGRVVLAENGSEALSQFMSGQFDIVVTDVNMPEMDGVELVKSIRGVDPDLPIVVVSSTDDRDRMIELINAGITHFITKPLDYAQAIGKLSDILQSRYYADIVQEMQEQLQKQNDELSWTVEKLEESNEDLRHYIRILETRSEQFNRLVSAYLKLKKSVEGGAEQKPEEKLLPRSEPEAEDFESYLDKEQKDDLQESEQQMDGVINLILLSHEIKGEKIFQLAALYRQYAAILRSIPKFSELADSITTLAQAIEEVDFDLAKSNEETILRHLESFTFTLISWRTKAFSGELKDANLFDQSLMADVKTICYALRDELGTLEGDIEFF